MRDNILRLTKSQILIILSKALKTFHRYVYSISLLYFTLLYFTLLYFTLLYFTLLYFTLLHFSTLLSSAMILLKSSHSKSVFDFELHSLSYPLLSYSLTLLFCILPPHFHLDYSVLFHYMPLRVQYAYFAFTFTFTFTFTSFSSLEIIFFLPTIKVQ